MTSTGFGSEGPACFGESLLRIVVSCGRLGVPIAGCLDGISNDSLWLVCYE